MMLLDAPDTVYSVGMKEALAFATGLVLLMLAGFGGLLQFFIKAKLQDLQAGQERIQTRLEETTEEMRSELAQLRDKAHAFELYAEREFVKRPEYDSSVTRLHARMDEVISGINNLNAKGRTHER